VAPLGKTPEVASLLGTMWQLWTYGTWNFYKRTAHSDWSK